MFHVPNPWSAGRVFITHSPFNQRLRFTFRAIVGAAEIWLGMASVHDSNWFLCCILTTWIDISSAHDLVVISYVLIQPVLSYIPSLSIQSFLPILFLSFSSLSMFVFFQKEYFNLISSFSSNSNHSYSYSLSFNSISSSYILSLSIHSFLTHIPSLSMFVFFHLLL